jgi:hypothetical protein
MGDQNLINVLYEELVHLDEMAGEYDEMTNHAIDSQRQKLWKQIQELEDQQRWALYKQIQELEAK